MAWGGYNKAGDGGACLAMRPYQVAGLNWLANWLVAFSFPLAQYLLGPYTFVLYAGVTPTATTDAVDFRGGRFAPEGEA